MRIREGDPLEIYTDKDGEVIFKKYSMMGGLSEFASQICETVHKTVHQPAIITDRDSIIALAGLVRREWMEKPISPTLENILESRQLYEHQAGAAPFLVTESKSGPLRLPGRTHHRPRRCAGLSFAGGHRRELGPQRDRTDPAGDHLRLPRTPHGRVNDARKTSFAGHFAGTFPFFPYYPHYFPTLFG